MILALTSRNQDIMWRLESSYFQRLGVLHKSVETGDDILKFAIRLRPQVVIVNWELPDIDGFELCGLLRTHPDLIHVRVLMAVRKEHLSSSVIRKADRAGAHNVLAYPLSDEDLYSKLSLILGLPRRLGRRISVSIDAEVENEGGRYHGRVKDLGIYGARVELDGMSFREWGSFTDVSLKVKRHAESRPITLDATVMWRSELSPAGSGVLGLEFPDLPSLVRRQISELAFWEVSEKAGKTIVSFVGDLTEATEFGELPTLLSGKVEFDVSGIRYINSTGLRSWVYFLEALHNVEEYAFTRISPPFSRQVSMIPGMLGRGKILSQFVPYFCEECKEETVRLREVSDDSKMSEMARHDFKCSICGVKLVLDDIPERLFGYLSG